MNTTLRDTSFAELFGATWNTFKTNYWICLGLGFLTLVISLVCAAASFSIAMSASSEDSIYAGPIAAIISQFIFFSVIVTPLTILLGFKIVSKLRGERGARSGWFSRVIIVSILFHVIILPSMICSQFSNPGQYEELKLMPEMITAGIQSVSEKQDRPNEDGPAFKRTREIQEEMNAFQENKSTGLIFLGGLLGLAGMFFTITWLPWAAFAACDPREECQGTSETLRRGWEISAGAKRAIMGSYAVMILIVLATFTMCLFPGIFFGFPLAFAWSPAVYLLLRDGGANTGPAEPV